MLGGGPILAAGRPPRRVLTPRLPRPGAVAVNHARSDEEGHPAEPAVSPARATGGRLQIWPGRSGCAKAEWASVGPMTTNPHLACRKSDEWTVPEGLRWAKTTPQSASCPLEALYGPPMAL